MESLLIFCTWQLTISLYQHTAEKPSNKVRSLAKRLGVLKFTTEFSIF